MKPDRIGRDRGRDGRPRFMRSVGDGGQNHIRHEGGEGRDIGLGHDQQTDQIGKP